MLPRCPQDATGCSLRLRARAAGWRQIRKAHRRVIKAAGLDPDLIVRHTFRHTAVTHLVQAGVHLPTVQKISGHKTLAMVSRYSHANGAHIDAAMDKLEGRISLGLGEAGAITPELHERGKAA